MTPGELVGTLGVTILLLAFALNLAKKVTPTSTFYLLMNIIGAALAGISSYMISFWPFVILEAVWTVASLWALISTKLKTQ
jgi:membrane-bound ClpP family serine protease